MRLRGPRAAPDAAAAQPGGAGVGKVSHRHWPAITGVFLTFPGFGGGRLVGAERADELLGHHRSDWISGGGSRDVIWGDWDPVGNSTRQRDRLSGGARIGLHLHEPRAQHGARRDG